MMFCRKCGCQLNDDAKFCSRCGEKVVNDGKMRSDTGNPGNVYGNSGSWVESEQKEKATLKDFLTADNIERFAPAAALTPLAMFAAVSILSIIFSLIFRILRYSYWPARITFTVSNVLIIMLDVLFIAVPVGATAGLIYIITQHKDMTKPSTWVTPFGTVMASLSCLGIAFGWSILAWICGIISVILGLEFLSRIVIAQQSIDSPINPGAAFATYKQYYNDYRAKNPTTKDLERAGIVDPENSKFDGAGIELLGYSILTFIVSVITCGIATPWMICKVYKWRISHTVINGKRLTFTGTGGSLFGHWILWEILSIITCGIYGLFLYVALRKWELSHTYIEGEPIVANGNESYFDGRSIAYWGYKLLGGLLLLITCSLAYPWVMAMLQKWDTKHQVINNRRLAFSGSGLGFLGEYLIIFILSVITCGIYYPWGIVRKNKYIIRNTDFVN